MILWDRDAVRAMCHEAWGLTDLSDEWVDLEIERQKAMPWRNPRPEHIRWDTDHAGHAAWWCRG